MGLGLIMGLAGTGLQLYQQHQMNQQIKDQLKIKTPKKKELEGLDIARGLYGESTARANAEDPAVVAAKQAILAQSAGTTAAAERSGDNPILAAAQAAGQANEATAGLAQQQSQYAMQRGQMKQQAGQGYQQALQAQRQAELDDAQTRMNAIATMGQGTNQAFSTLSGLGGGLMGNAAYLQGKQGTAGKAPTWWTS